MTGSFSGAVNLGGNTLTSAGPADIFVVKLGPDGSHVWSKSYGDSNAQSGAAIAVDEAGNVLLTGSFSGAVNFGGGTLGAIGSDAFALKLGPDGAHRWSHRHGDQSAQTGRGIAADSAGNVFVAGSFSGAADFGDITLTSAGNSDAFVAAYAP